MPGLVLTDLSRLKIMTEISESDLKYARLGKKVNIEIPSVNYKGTGVVSSIIPSSNPMTHKFRIKIKFNSNGKMVFPGMYTKVYINK